MSFSRRAYGPALLMLLSTPAGLPVMTGPARAQRAPDAGPVVVFDIAAQPLDQALLAYGRIANVQLLYDAGIVHGQVSSTVRGSFHAREALELMLRGTGLRARYTSPTAITLAAIPAPSAQTLRMQPMRIEGAPEPLDRARLSLYVDRVQSRIVAALQHHPTTNHIAYDVTLHLWLGEDGGITRTVLVSSNVTPRQTSAVLAVVTEAGGGEAPPPGMPQPVAFRFRSRPLY